MGLHAFAQRSAQGYTQEGRPTFAGLWCHSPPDILSRGISCDIMCPCRSWASQECSKVWALHRHDYPELGQPPTVPIYDQSVPLSRPLTIIIPRPHILLNLGRREKTTWRSFMGTVIPELTLEPPQVDEYHSIFPEDSMPCLKASLDSIVWPSGMLSSSYAVV